MSYIKRIHNEIVDLYTKNGHNITTEYTEYGVIVTIDKNLKFKLPVSYPFEKPEVFYNEKLYNQTLRTPSPRFSQIMVKNKIDCFCCATALCNWIPMYTMLTIINEIKLNKTIKQNIVYHIMIDEIDTDKKNMRFNISEIKQLIMGFLI
jgi:hypothetical protein